MLTVYWIYPGLPNRTTKPYSSTDRQTKSSYPSCHHTGTSASRLVISNGFRIFQWGSNLTRKSGGRQKTIWKPREWLGKPAKRSTQFPPTSSHETVKIQKGLKKATQCIDSANAKQRRLGYEYLYYMQKKEKKSQDLSLPNAHAAEARKPPNSYGVLIVRPSHMHKKKGQEVGEREKKLFSLRRLS